MKTYSYNILLYITSFLKIDIKPNNILVNYNSGSRFSDIKLADYGDSIYIDSIVEEYIIKATIFRSPKAILNLIWGPPIDI